MHEEEALGQVSSVPNFPRSLPSSSSQMQDDDDEDEEGSGAPDDYEGDSDNDEVDEAGGEFHQAEIALRDLAVDDASMLPDDEEEEIR